MRLLLVCLLLTASPVLASPSSITVTTGGVSYHGGEIDPEVADRMPNRIDQGGKAVYHNPEYGLTYYSGLFQTNALYLKDSFNNPAVYVGGGFTVEFPFKHLFLGGTAGLYTRGIESFTTKKGEQVRVYSGPVLAEVSGYETIGMGFLTALWTIPVQDKLYFVLSAASNYALTHITAGFQYRINY